ncbi:hypothetical protein GALL_494200 [mine drainage metagenome]|uniref:Uncharacterized protein n=1 Tax=mine drainage metagenome TaxID=410659 RepID=A0A1J5PZE1_9ZZZZ
MHVRGSDPVRFSVGQSGSGNMAQRVKHLDGVGAPAFAQLRRALQCQQKTRVAHGEVLSAMVKRAKSTVTGRHAPAQRRTFFEQGDTVTGLYQGAGASDTGHAGTNDGDVLWGPWGCSHQ